MKYQNKDGISLNYTQRNNIHTDLVKEIISEAITMLEKVVEPSSMPIRAHQSLKIKDTITFLKENFDLKVIEDYIDE